MMERLLWDMVMAGKKAELRVWQGEESRPSLMTRPCSCGTCEAVAPEGGVGFLSASTAEGAGFTVWVFDEDVYQRMLLVYGGDV
jgi:hypothetical protein